MSSYSNRHAHLSRLQLTFKISTFGIVISMLMLLLSACAEESDLGSANKAGPSFTVTASAGAGGTISPASASVNANETASFTVTADVNYHVSSVTGCNGSLNTNNVYQTGPITANCAVSATFQSNTPVTHTVSTNVVGSGGAIAPTSATVNDGESAVFTITPAANFMIQSVSGCNGTLNGNTYTTGAITADCTVSASFQALAPVTHVVTANAGPGGSISPGSANVADNMTFTFTVTPDANYSIQTVSGCNGTLSGNSYTTGPITADCTVNATFMANTITYTVSAQTAGVGGTISPATATVNDGDVATFSVTPATGYNIDTVTGCSGSLTNTTYTTGPIHADCQVTASFIIRTFTVSTSVGPGGRVTPDSQIVNYNDRASFTITPDPHYVIASAGGCRGSLSGSVYTTTRIRANCQVSISFALEQFPVTANAGTGGTIAPGNVNVNYNDTASFTVAPDPNFLIDVVSGCGGSLTPATGSTPATYTTGAITGACAVNASFVAISVSQFTVTSSAGSGGGVTPAAIDVAVGNVTTFDLQPDNNFRVATVSGCKGTLSNNSYTTAAINAACNVAATFVSPSSGTLQTVNTAPSVGGDLNPNAVRLLEGSQATFTVLPDAGYQLISISGCDGTLTGATFQTQDISNDCTLTANFSASVAAASVSGGNLISLLPSYIMFSQSGSGGSITPLIANVIEGNSVDFLLTPDPGFVVDTVSGCGGNLNANVFTSAAASASNDGCYVTATFRPITP